MRFLDNVLQDFIDRAPPEMAPASYAAARERSVGLGLMGFHSFLQGQNVSRSRAPWPNPGTCASLSTCDALATPPARFWPKNAVHVPTPPSAV